MHPRIITTHNQNNTPFPPTTIKSTVYPQLPLNIHIWIIKHIDQRLKNYPHLLNQSTQMATIQQELITLFPPRIVSAIHYHDH